MTIDDGPTALLGAGSDTGGGPRGAGGPVAVYAPPGPARSTSLAWAAAYAEHAGTEMLVLLPPAGSQDDERPPAAYRSPIARAAGGPLRLLAGPLWGPALTHLLDRWLRAFVPAAMERAVTPAGWGRSSPSGSHEDTVVEHLLAWTSRAAALVVPSDLSGVQRLVDDAACPVAAIPARAWRRDGPVVVACQGPTGDPVDDELEDAVLAVGFDAAAAAHSPLVVVHAEASAAEPSAVVEGDGLRRRTADLVSARALTAPDVRVDLRPTRSDPAPALLPATVDAGLVVLGRTRRGRLRVGWDESPVRVLMRAARCPVLVVPAPEPPGRARRRRHRPAALAALA